ncbi:hypothetical protein Ahy_A05g021805 [Arachis hypogaea]|uniref:Transposase MuDR plant domain-containing protein n=1 Tax=Arachis hypogaea TaxID=3818 RepID=A0A445CYH7_ARAHY|nr:hypothetical protein Ahy_A05g021805 [Arachis hypogaea]
MCAAISSKIGDKNASFAAIRTNIRKLMVDLNMTLEGNQGESNPNDYNDVCWNRDGSTIGDPMQDHYQIHLMSDDKDVDAKLVDIPEEEHEELNDFTMSQPAISRPYDHLTHYSTLNLDAMNGDWSFGQGGSEDNPTHDFEIGQQFDNKEVVMAVKMYSIKRAVEYKIVESNQFENICIACRQKQEKWEIRRCSGPHSCMQTTLGQDHGRLDSKVIAEHVLSMVKTDPTINIRVLQKAVENHFGYKTSYKKV